MRTAHWRQILAGDSYMFFVSDDQGLLRKDIVSSTASAEPRKACECYYRRVSGEERIRYFSTCVQRQVQGIQKGPFKLYKLRRDKQDIEETVGYLVVRRDQDGRSSYTYYTQKGR